MLSLYSHVNSFHLKLQLHKQDLEGDLLHFPTLKTLIDETECDAVSTADFIAFIKKLDMKLNEHFSQFRALSHVIHLIKSPLIAKTDGEWRTQIQ